MTLINRAKAIWKLFTGGGLDKTDKIVLVLALLYCLSPIDIVPDVVPIVGFLDDLVLVLAALRHISGKGAGKREGDDANLVQVDAKVVQ